MRRSTVGFLDIRHLKRLPPDDPVQRELYEELLRLGFQHNVWQVVYPGQQMGVIIAQDKGRREVHVRFFDTHVEAELEVARRYVAHFFRGRCCAKDNVLGMLGDEALQKRASTVFRPRALRKSEEPPTDSFFTFESLSALIPLSATVAWACGYLNPFLPMGLTLAQLIFWISLPRKPK